MCTARSTRLMVPKGTTYAVKISRMTIADETYELMKDRDVPHIIQCLWSCHADFVDIETPVTINRWHQQPQQIERVWTYNIFAMEYFPHPSLAQFIRQFSEAIPTTDFDARGALLSEEGPVRTAYFKVRNASLDFFRSSWIHRDFHPTNVLYNPENGDLRFINIEDSENYDLIRETGYISPLSWMHYVAADYRMMFFAIIVTVYCPEEYIPVPHDHPEDEPNPATRDCIEQQEMLEQVQNIDPDFDMVLEFLHQEPSDRSLNMLPESLQIICRLVGRPQPPPGPEPELLMHEERPPGYNSVYPDSLEDEDSHFLATIRSEFDKMDGGAGPSGLHSRTQTSPGEAGPSGLLPGHGPEPPSELPSSQSSSNTDDSNIGREAYAAYQVRHEGSDTSGSSNHAGTRTLATPEGVLPTALSDSSSEIRSRLALSGFSSNGRGTPRDSGTTSNGMDTPVESGTISNGVDTPIESRHSSSAHSSDERRENIDPLRDIGRPRTAISTSETGYSKRFYFWIICVSILFIALLRYQTHDASYWDYYPLECEI